MILADTGSIVTLFEAQSWRAQTHQFEQPGIKLRDGAGARKEAGSGESLSCELPISDA